MAVAVQPVDSPFAAEAAPDALPAPDEQAEELDALLVQQAAVVSRGWVAALDGPLELERLVWAALQVAAARAGPV